MPQPNPFPDDIHWDLQPAGEFLSFDQGALQARVYKTTGHLELAGPDIAGTNGANLVQFAPPAVHSGGGSAVLGRVISSKQIGDGLELTQTLGASRVTSQLTFSHVGVMRYEVTDWGPANPVATAVAAPSDAREHFFGFGEKYDGLDQAGKTVRILTFDDPGTKGDHSYKVAPWFMSTRGYGFHLDSSAESVFDMRAGGPNRYVVLNQLGTLRFNVVYGPQLTDVLARYTGYTGRPFLPSPWVFGPWISSDVWRSGGEVRYAVTQFRTRGIPASAFVFDSPWETAYNDFQFNMVQFGRDATIDGVHYPGFASLIEMMTFLRSNGLKAICWMAPFINVQSGNENIPGQNLGKAGNYDEAARQGLFVRAASNGPALVVPWWKGKGSPVDFTNPASRQWLTDQLRALLKQSEVITQSGVPEPVIGGFKTDDGESGNGPNTYIPATAQYSDGRTGAEMRNGYCLEYHKTISSVLGDKGILFARSGFTGSHAFPGCWAGDNEPNFGDNGLPGVIVAGQSAAMSGFAIWGHDIGGYQDTNPSQSPPNLFMRWTQFGCFSPIMQMHRQVTKELQYPWRYGTEALQNYLFFAKLHTRLFPYIYTYAKEASDTGLPIIRPAVLLNQTDANTFNLQHTYFFGNEFLVAPMITPDASSRQVYLPAGQWFDFWTNQPQAGARTINWQNNQQAQLPLFVREGAIIPMLLNDAQTLCNANYVNTPSVKTADRDLQFWIYPGQPSHFAMYDGTDIRCEGSGHLTITVASTARGVLLRALVGEPAAVTRDGAAVPRLTTPGQFDAALTGWRADAQAGLVFIKFQHAGGVTRIEL
jgi:alpha-D-xyloside xylohydrolase